MVDMMMFRILSIQEKINVCLENHYKKLTNPEQLKEFFIGYCEILKNSVFRVEVVKVIRQCFCCKSRDMKSFYELNCSHVICVSCSLKKKISINDGKDLAVCCECTSYTEVKKLEELKIIG